MIGVPEAFSSSYALARIRFIEAASNARLLVASYKLAETGREGEQLAMDVALDSPSDANDAERLLIVSSGCHGVEGFCGSGVQTFALHDEEWREKARAQGVAVLYVHALNPYGFSHLRRVTQENVDLNRNFHDFAQPLPENPAYAALQPLLLPAEWPPSSANYKAIDSYVVTHGQNAFQAAVSQGQHAFADGMFFGGTAPTWSNTTWRDVLRRYAQRARRIAWIDLHTGLGPNGIGERIFAGRDDQAGVQRARAWWGEKQVTSIYDGSSSSALLTGLMFNSLVEECAQAEYTGIALEFGTLPLLEVMQALRADHWLHQHPEAPAELAAEIKTQLLQAFYCDNDAWKGQVISQARQAMFQAVDGLSR
ncbi:M14 family metallopeptidase [Variovorax sp. HJSM1_2]|uniref:M14 family metallopeptidase n=1 Tax=Variovorax sp. HJSM1_2 TaxID=3366263 RepID=UPI003BD4E310